MNFDVIQYAKNFRIMREAIENTLMEMQHRLDGLAREIGQKIKAEENERLMGNWQLPRLHKDLHKMGRDDYRVLFNTPSVALLPELSGLNAYQKTLVTRTYNHALVQTRAHTIGHLVLRTEPELRRFRNLGKRSIQLLKLCLETNGLSLGMNVEAELFDPNLSTKTSDFLRGLPKKTVGEIEEAFEGRIEGLPPWADIREVGDLLLRNETQLLSLTGFTEKHLRIVKRRLEKLGLSLMTRSF